MVDPLSVFVCTVRLPLMLGPDQADCIFSILNFSGAASRLDPTWTVTVIWASLILDIPRFNYQDLPKKMPPIRLVV